LFEVLINLVISISSLNLYHRISELQIDKFLQSWELLITYWNYFDGCFQYLFFWLYGSHLQQWYTYFFIDYIIFVKAFFWNITLTQFYSYFRFFILQKLIYTIDLSKASLSRSKWHSIAFWNYILPRDGFFCCKMHKCGLCCQAHIVMYYVVSCEIQFL
jgi:hypothetical protein